jgi:hypothetical protein
MPNQIYKSAYIHLVDGTELFISPLKIKYLRELMEVFKHVQPNAGDDSIDLLLECATVAMRQYYPSIKTRSEVEDNIDIDTLYTILEIGAGIKLKSDEQDSEDNDEKKTNKNPEQTWDNMDIVTLESEVFLLGIWKDYDDLESSLCMEELTTTLNAKRESEYREKKFLAAIQGIDLDKETGKEDAWEAMKARVFSGGKAKDGKDILAFQGVNAQKAGFGIGMGLGYEDLTKK